MGIGGQIIGQIFEKDIKLSKKEQLDKSLEKSLKF